MKLNIGSGYPRGEYVNWVNIDDAPEATFKASAHVIKMSVLKMDPTWNDKFETIHCIHVLEHLNRNSRQEAFSEIYRVCAPKGTLFLEVPNFKEIIGKLYNAYLHNQTEEIHIWKTSIYGKQRYDGDAHHWGFDESHLIELAKKAGFQRATCWKEPERMVSRHWKQEPVILLVATK